VGCPLCSKSSSTMLDFNDKFLSHYKKCNNCNILYDESRRPVDYVDTYRDYSKYYAELGAGMQFFMYTFYILDTAIRGNDMALSKSLLDIGASAGFTIDIAKFFGWNSVGIEPDREISEWGKKNLDVEIINSTLEDVKITRKFDGIISSEVIEHVADPVDFCKQICDLLKEDGVLLLTTPNLETKVLQRKPTGTSLMKNWHNILQQVHITVFSQKGLETLLHKAGFEYVISFTTEGETEDLRIVALASKKRQIDLDLSNISRSAGKERKVIELMRAYLEDRLRKYGSNSLELWNGLSWRLLSNYNSLGEFDEAIKLGKAVEGKLKKLSLTRAEITSRATNIINSDFGSKINSFTKSLISEFQKWLPFSLGEFYFNYAMANLQNKKTSEALELFKISYDIFRAMDKMTNVVWNRANRQIDYLNEVFYQNDFEPMILQSLYHIALCHLFLGQREIAIGGFDEILNRGSSNEMLQYTLFNKGVAYLQLGRYPESISIFEQIINGNFSKDVIEKSKTLQNEATRNLFLQKLEAGVNLISQTLEQVKKLEDSGELTEVKDRLGSIENQVQILQTQFQSKDDNIQNLTNKLGLVEKSTTELQHIIKSKDDNIQNLKQLLQSRDEWIKDLKTLLTTRENDIKNSQNIIQSKDEYINDLKALLTAKENEIQDIFKSLELREKDIQNITTKLSLSERSINELHLTIKSKDDSIQKLEQVLQSSENSIYALRRQLSEKQSHIEELQRVLQEYQDQALRFSNELRQIQETHGYKLVQRARMTLDSKFPHGSYSRKLIDHVVESAIKKQVITEKAGSKFNFGELARDQVYEQEIAVVQDNLFRIDIMIATFMRINNCTISFTIKDSGGDILRKIIANASKFIDNGYFPIVFNPLQNFVGKNITLEIKSSDCSPGNSITFWCTRSPENSTLKINSQAKNCSIIHKVFYKSNDLLRS
jgi:2-polyprenyl-3-methyl-5-hydroxy-6-metoxy-1,4-benzoquinol methylase/tetratricopeptide (TPR) repeat protein